MVEFEKLQRPSSAKVNEKDRPPEPDTTDNDGHFARLWEKRRKHHAGRLAAIDFEAVMGNGLRWLATLAAVPLDANPFIDSQLRDVNIVFRPAGKQTSGTGVSFCHHDPRVLWRRLDRLIGQAQAAKAHGLLGRLVVLRPAELGTTPTAKERLDKIQRGGSVVVLVQGQQLAELAAYQELLAKAQTGAITDNGRPITGAEFTAWARTNLSSAVKELADSVFGPDLKPATPTPAQDPTPARRRAPQAH